MKYTSIIFFCLISIIATAKNNHPYPYLKTQVNEVSYKDSLTSTENRLSADTLLSFAKSLIGTRYRSAASNPSSGFDCSGFVNYVFKNFKIDVPRSSCEFDAVGEKIKLADALPGDIILFTGTSKRSRRIGHVAIVICNDNDEIRFIHSTSGKKHGVTITTMDKYYHRRFVEVVRVL